MRALGPHLLALALAAAGPLVAQCPDPPPPPGGFAVRIDQRLDVTYSDRYRTQATAAYPTARPGPCGWPMLVLVPGLGANRVTLAPEVRTFASQGYFVVTYDVRGQASARALNPGKGSLLWALDEWIDLAEIIEWTGSTYRGRVDASRVAVAGDSQGGVHAWAAAAYSEKRFPPNARRTRAFPKIACVIPRVFPAQTVDVFVPEGKSFFYRMSEFAYEDRLPSVLLDDRFRSRLRFYLDADDPSGLEQYLRSIPGKDFTAGLRSTEVPVFHGVTWHDVFTPIDLSLAALDMLPKSTPRRLYVSTGYHGTPLNSYQFLQRQEITLDWMNRFMKRGREPVEVGPPVLAAAIPADPGLYNHIHYLWRHRADALFPPPDVKTSRLYLRSAQRLTSQQPQGFEGPGLVSHRVQAGYDARGFQRDGADLAVVKKRIPLSSLVFTTTPMAAAIEIAGRPSVTLAIRPTHPDVQIGVRLVAITSDNRRQLVASGGAGIRGADTRRTVPLKIVLGSTMSVIPRGTRLGLEIQDQVIHTAGKDDTFRYLPAFHDYVVTVGYQPGRVSYLDLPLRPIVRPDLSTGETVIEMPKPLGKPFVLRTTPDRKGLPYLILASLSGQTPTPLPGGNRLYLQLDFVTTTFLGLSTTPLLIGFAGVLDANGGAQAALRLGPVGPIAPGLAGYNLHLAPVVLGRGEAWAGAPLQLRFR